MVGTTINTKQGNFVNILNFVYFTEEQSSMNKSVCLSEFDVYGLEILKILFCLAMTDLVSDIFPSQTDRFRENSLLGTCIRITTGCPIIFAR